MKKGFLIPVLVSFLFLLLGQTVSAMQWEVGILSKDAKGNVIPIVVTVYTYNSLTREWVYFDHGSTKSASLWDNGHEINGYFDIDEGGSDSPIMKTVPRSDRIAIKIENKFFDMEFEGGSGYGDMVFHYNTDNHTMSLDWKSEGCDYYERGSGAWSDYNITLRNDFGNDRDLCVGNIYLNDELLPNVGYSGVTETREASTFPHTATAINGQTINNYYREWRYWNNGAVTDSTIQLSAPNSYELIAKYAMRVNNNLTSNGCIDNYV